MSGEPGPRLGRGVRAAAVGVLALVLVAVMFRLALWQWDRAQARHSLLNYTYAVEWVLFALLTVAGLARLAVEDVRAARQADAQDGGDDAPAPVRSVQGTAVPMIGPPLQPGEELEEITLHRLRRRIGLERG